MRLKGRTALVTGSTDGIGAAIAQALAAEGAAVIVTGRKDSQTVAAIEEAGGQASFIRADLSEAAEIRDLAAAAGPVDILVNNAAMLIFPAPTEDVEEEVIDQALSINVKAAFLLTGLLAPAMADRGEGTIINIGSINGFLGMAQSALYSTTKAAIHSLTKSWAAEYGPSGVRVNTVAPGPTLTPKIASIQERIAPIVQAVPSGRASTPEEVAKAVVFLASDDASNIHGATLSVDGGRMAV
jgi:NAD(P)-dependent dehydrogenase (short-subunit alcohol dehydrogenase family)